MNIRIFGDSIMQGVMYDGERDKYKLRAGNKFQYLSEMGHEIKNTSKMGATILYGYKDLNSRLSKEEKPIDLLILEYGGNDSNCNWQEVSDDPAALHLPAVSIDVYVDTYRKTIDAARKFAGKIAICTIPPIDSEKYFRFITKGCSAENILSWLGDRNFLYRFHESYNEKIPVIAEEMGVELIDLRRPFLLRRDFTELTGDDGIHPSEKGYELIDRIICEAVKEME